jgi:aryl-alcohol dehydrogenase-like predicted oxidoreductase
VVYRRLGRTGFEVSPIGFGAFKIGRNEQIKYSQGYELPDDDQTGALLNGVLDLGINLIDTAPAYGVSEQRIGRFISHRRSEFVLSTKVGETFKEGRSIYDFSERAVRLSISRSRKLLKTDVLGIVFVHSSGEDLEIITNTDVVATLQSLRDEGLIRAIGFSGKTVEGAKAALAWADVLMIEYHLNDRSHEEVIDQAADAGIGVVVKKALASGTLDPQEAIRFALSRPGVSSVIVGSLNLDHVAANLAVAERPD